MVCAVTPCLVAASDACPSSFVWLLPTRMRLPPLDACVFAKKVPSPPYDSEMSAEFAWSHDRDWAVAHP